jgi:predicted ATPase
MEIKFEGKYKSITSFTWSNIPNFVVITGPNGTGKSQLLELIYNSLVRTPETNLHIEIIGKHFKANEVTFLKGEWQLQNTQHINLSTLMQKMDNFYQHFQQNNHGYNHDTKIRIDAAFKEIITKSQKPKRDISKEEFEKLFPEILIENEQQLSQKIAEIFYNYRLSEIEFKADGKSEEDIILSLGEKPWNVLRDIIREAKLPFDINDPSKCGFRENFQLKLTHIILKEEIKFSDLSSGEKVLISLVFYLYNSQEKNVFPKLFLLDEPDAHLHPSMSQQFLNVIKNVLVDKFGVQVIMTTHSPSTVILAPFDAIYEMSSKQPRIIKSPSKNHSVSLLTAGLVYVGEGTKYFLVEDEDDATFYSFVYNQLSIENKIDTDIPLVFIPSSASTKSGGKDVVRSWVNKLQDSGLVNVVHGLIDADYDNEISEGIYKISRYSIENYLIDPILVYAALIDKEQNPGIEGIHLTVGEEYKLKSLSNENLQLIADKIISMIEPQINDYFENFDSNKEFERVEIFFTNGSKLLYPKWLLNRRGKTILNSIYNDIFKSSYVNQTTLFKALRKLNIFPHDLVEKLNDIKNG